MGLKMDLSGQLPANLTLKLTAGGAFYCRLTAIAPQVFPDLSEVLLRFGDPRELDILDMVTWPATVVPTYAQFEVPDEDVLELIKNEDIVQGDAFYAMLIYRHPPSNTDIVWARTSSGEVDW